MDRHSDMKILRIAKRVPPCPGGQERHVLELTHEQAALGHAVTLLYGEGSLGGGDGWEALAVPWQPEASLGLGTRQSLSFTRAVRAWCADHPVDCDLVHAHGDYPEAWLAAELGRRWRVPAVTTVHASFGRRSWLRDQLRRRAFTRLDHVFCVSAHTGDQLRQMGVRRPITVQHSGTRIAPLRGIPREPSPAPQLVAVGRLVPLKGFDYLIEAVRLLVPSWPELRLDIFGAGPLEQELRALAAGLPQVHLHGEASRDEVYAALRQAWLFVLSSVDLPGIMEGMPTTVIEAMAAGLPVVATRVAGVPEVVRDGVHGLLVEPADAARLAAAIGRLLDDDQLRLKLGADNEAEGQAFDWREVAKVFTGVCERLVERSTPSA